MQKVISFEIKKGSKFAKEFVKEETDLTADMLATWVQINFGLGSKSSLTITVGHGNQLS